MSDRVITRINTIGAREGQDRTFHFLNRRKETFEWTDSVPEDDPEFQGLLKNKGEAPFLTLVLSFQEWNWRVKNATSLQ